jgi:hypothetical protein
MKLSKLIIDALLEIRVITGVTFLFLFLNVLLFLLGKLGVGSDIFGYMTEGGRFDDYYNVFVFSPDLPNPGSSIQYSALAIIFGRAFGEYQWIGTAVILLVGVLLPVHFIRRQILMRFDKSASIYILFIATSYPVLFGFFRGNPTLIGVLWSISGVLAFISGSASVSKFSFLIGSLFHPVPAFFSVLFLKDGVKYFLRLALMICLSQLFLYACLGGALVETIGHVVLSLEKYKLEYVIGSGGDLYNNSIFFPIKVIFIDNAEVLNFALKFVPPFAMGLIIIKAYIGSRIYGGAVAFLVFCLYFLPISLVIFSPVSADYRLGYLLIPVVLMLVMRSFGLPFFLLLAVLLPKHFVFFSSYWLSIHPSASLVYPDIIKTLGITLNSFLNPVLLVACILIPNSYIVKFIIDYLDKDKSMPGFVGVGH